MVFGAVGGAIWFLFPMLNLLGIMIVVLICCYVLIIWRGEGGFMAWKSEEIKKFMDNAKKAGL